MSLYLHNYPMKWAELGLLPIYESVKELLVGVSYSLVAQTGRDQDSGI